MFYPQELLGCLTCQFFLRMGSPRSRPEVENRVLLRDTAEEWGEEGRKGDKARYR